MEDHRRSLFASYVGEDIDDVQPLVAAIRSEFGNRKIPIEIWGYVDSLKPGENWQRSIESGLQNSIGALIFVSHASLKLTRVATELLHKPPPIPEPLTILIILDEELILPPFLTVPNSIRLKRNASLLDAQKAARQVALFTSNYLRSKPDPAPAAGQGAARTIAAEVVEEVRLAEKSYSQLAAPNAVFLVHGHDLAGC